MKRFYKTVAVTERSAGYAVTLDDKVVHTPGGADLEVLSRGLAQAMAMEWDAQKTDIDPTTMPLNRIANTALDRGGDQAEAIAGEIAAFIQTDLLCYRAVTPDSLARRTDTWGRTLGYGCGQASGVTREVTPGVTAVIEEEQVMSRTRGLIGGFSGGRLVALHTAAAATGSAVIALALAADHLDVAHAWSAAQVDETFQAEQWGEDAEAMAVRDACLRDLSAAALVFRLCPD